MALMRWRSHKKRSIPEELWVRCPGCREMLFPKDLDDRLKVCPKCEHHLALTSHERIAFTLDRGSWQEFDGAMETVDVLGFVDRQPYPQKLVDSTNNTGVKEAMRYGLGAIEGRPIVFGTLEFRFLGGSKGVVVGEKGTRAIELARARRVPLVPVSPWGGARMHEGILSLMQMAKTCAALAGLRDAGGFYISVCAHPTTGGVTASWAMAADVILAEPGALIGFAGPRVIEGTIKKKLPPGFQTSEFLLDKGQIDMIVPRLQMRATLARVLAYAPVPAETPGRLANAGRPA